MKRITLLLSLVLLQPAAYAAVYKCTVDGKVAFQATPCTSGQGSALDIKPMSSSNAATRQCQGKEIRIHFSDMPLQTTLKVLADYSGNRLELAPNIGGNGAFHYDCVPWDTVLKDIADKYRLQVTVGNGTIRAMPR